jgi:hypothetical protein
LDDVNRLSRYVVAFRSYTGHFLDSSEVFKDGGIAIPGTMARQEPLRLSRRRRQRVRQRRS